MFWTEVPIRVERFTEETAEYYIDALKQSGTTRVWLCPRGALCGEAEKASFGETEKAHLDYVKRTLEQAGFDTGIWIGGIYHLEFKKPYTRMVTADGKRCDAIVCPSDPKFLHDFAEKWVKPFVATGIPTLMFDDDFRMNFNDHGPLCFCDTHMARYAERLGHPVTREEMREKLLSGEPNEYREAWLQESRRTLVDYAKAMRAAADEVNPDCRLCISAAPALWGLDGACAEDGLLAVELARILAGKQTPHLRLSGGPMYMSPYFQNIFKHRTFAQTIEFDRMQAALCKNLGVTVCAENDSYPRPRYVVPAAYLELLDMVARADGNFTGTQKYMLEYEQEPSYETGYLDASAEDQPLLKEIEREFAGKTLTGVRVFHPLDNMRYRRYREDGCAGDLEVDISNVAGQRYLTDNSVPVVYEGAFPTVIFGSTAEQAGEEQLRYGAILDLEAAEILTRRGIDVGLAGITEAVKGGILGDIELDPVNFEHYLVEASFVPINRPELRGASAAASARILSELVVRDRISVGSYLYENSNGQKFYVLAFDAVENMFHDGMFRSYHRQKHLIQAYEWLTGHPMDAVCVKNPDLYLLTKKNEKELAVGLWNFSPDAISHPLIELGGDYRRVRGINCTAELEGRQVRLSKLHAYEFAGIVVER